MPEVILTTSKGDGAEIVSVYDTAFRLLRRGRLRPEAHVTAGGDEWQAPTLSFPYLVWEGGDYLPSARLVLRRVDLESGADELVFTGDTGRGIGEVVAHPTTGDYLFAYYQRRGPQDQGGSAVVELSSASPAVQAAVDRASGTGGAVVELWSASPGSAERIRFEDSYLAVMSDAETDPRENPDGWSPLADIRPLAVTPDGRHLFFARNRLYVLELTSGKVEQVGTRYFAVTRARPSPDGTRVAVPYQDPDNPNAFRVAIVELDSGRAQEIQSPDALWHPDGKRLACTGGLDLGAPPGVPVAGDDTAVFLVDLDTGAVREVARYSRTPSAPPRPEDLRNPHGVGFSRNGRTLFVTEQYVVPKPTSTTTTTAVFEEESPPEEESPREALAYTYAYDLVAVDIETNRRERVLTGVNSPLLLHR